MTLSMDLRDRAVEAVLGGEICRAAAARFGVSAASVVRWMQRYRLHGSAEPAPRGGGRRPVLDQHRVFILKRIGETPHLTLHGLKDELAARGVKVSHNAVWLFLRREGLSFKKSMSRPVCKCFVGLVRAVCDNVSGLRSIGLAKMEIRASRSS